MADSPVRTSTSGMSSQKVPKAETRNNAHSLSTVTEMWPINMQDAYGDTSICIGLGLLNSLIYSGSREKATFSSNEIVSPVDHEATVETGHVR